MMIGVRIAFAFEKYDMVTFNNSNFLNYYQCQYRVRGSKASKVNIDS